MIRVGPATGRATDASGVPPDTSQDDPGTMPMTNMGRKCSVGQPEMFSEARHTAESPHWWSSPRWRDTAAEQTDGE